MKDILNILSKISKGEKLSVDDNKALTEFLAYTENPDKLPQDKQAEFDSASALANEMSDSIQAYVSSDTYKKAQESIQKQIKADKITGATAEILNLGLSIGDLVTSGNQIRSADRGISNLKRPSIPTPPGVDPALSQALVGAERDINLAPGRAIGPAQLQVMDQYLKDINTAKTASTGQASNFGALAQVASTRRNRASQSLAPIAEQARQNAIGNRNNLLGIKGNQRQNDFSNRLAATRLQEDRYNRDAQALGALGSAGRTNRQTAFNNLASVLPSVLGGASQLDLGGLFGSSQIGDAFGPEIAGYADKIQNDLYSRFLAGDLITN